MSNLKLWQSVEKTDLSYAKEVKVGARRYTSIAPQYQAKIATDAFGPYGKGWGLKESKFDTAIFETTGMVIHNAVFFYVLGGEESSFPISNSIQPVPVYKSGPKADEEWVKKIETNTISKALSRLGFNADVFMGLFDDTEYRALLKIEQDIEKAQDQEKATKEKIDDLSGFVLRQIDAIESSAEPNVVAGVVRSALRHLDRQRSIASLQKTADRGIAAIEKAHEKFKLKNKEAS